MFIYKIYNNLCENHRHILHVCFPWSEGGENTLQDVCTYLYHSLYVNYCIKERETARNMKAEEPRSCLLQKSV